MTHSNNPIIVLETHKALKSLGKSKVRRHIKGYILKQLSKSDALIENLITAFIQWIVKARLPEY